MLWLISGNAGCGWLKGPTGCLACKETVVPVAWASMMVGAHVSLLNSRKPSLYTAASMHQDSTGCTYMPSLCKVRTPKQPVHSWIAGDA